MNSRSTAGGILESVIAFGAARPKYARLFCPDDWNGIGLVVANSLFFESNNSRHFLITACRQFCSKGYQVLFFDYHGTGESDGDTTALSIASVQEDVAEAVSYMVSLGSQRVVPIGFRAGAVSVAGLSGLEHLAGRVLWAPISKGKDYAKLQALTAGIDAAERRSANETATVVAGGWEVSRGFWDSLMAWSLDAELTSVPDDLLVVGFGKARHPDLEDRAERSSGRISLEWIESEKFWLFGGSCSSREAVEVTSSWLERVLASPENRDAEPTT
jgi:pimeloyl-ACP methyl ester carboxylesterase